MIIAGIDPGLSGAVCILHGSSCRIADMPTFVIKRGGKTKRDIDALELSRILTRDIDHAFVEAVNSMPGQGVSSVFSFGKSFGIIIGILAAKRIPYTLVPPQTWKKALKVPASKDASRARASQLMPRHAHNWSRVKDDGRAESCLIALFGEQSNDRTAGERHTSERQAG